MSIASFIGGNSVLSVSQWDQWKSTVENNPERIYFKLSPIADLIEDPEKKANWLQAVQEIEQAAQQKAERTSSKTRSLFRTYSPRRTQDRQLVKA